MKKTIDKSPVVAPVTSLVDTTQKVLEVKHLKKYFKVGSGSRKLMVPAVDDVTIDVFKREVFGVVGESGSGKTTLGRTIIKLYEPTEGSVTLNGITISAGFADHLSKIAELKKEEKLEILKLSPNKHAIYQHRLALQEKIAELSHQMHELSVKHQEAIKALRHTHDSYRSQLYRLKSQLKIDLEAIEFSFLQQKKVILDSTKNQAALKYKNEIAIAEVKFERKTVGIKDSAALNKETIAKRLEQLKEEHDLYLVQLKESFEPQIEAAEKEILTHEQAHQKIALIEAEKHAKEAVVNKQFHKEVSQLVKPDVAQFKANILLQTKEFTAAKKVIVDSIIAVKQTKFVDPVQVSQSALSPTDRLQAIKAIKTKYAQLIAEQRAMIAETKRINKSKDTLHESQKMQMIFQDPISSLNPRMTVREIIGEGLTIQGGYSKQQIADKVEEVLKLVGLAPEYATRYPHEFSGGQRQRIGVARALIMQPNVIIADEPISALDVSIRAQIINLLSGLREQLGLTVLFIAHDLSVVRFFCDRIAVMHNGKVVELASSDELFKRPLHSYTVSLLSAIPQPDPDYEKNRSRIHYNPSAHNYWKEKPSLREIVPGHSVYANDTEFEAMKIKYAEFLALEGKE